MLSTTNVQSCFSWLKSSAKPSYIQNGLIIERTDLTTAHEETNIIIVQQAYQFILDVGTKLICVICNDTDVFVFLVFSIRNWAYKPMFHASNQL